MVSRLLSWKKCFENICFLSGGIGASCGRPGGILVWICQMNRFFIRESDIYSIGDRVIKSLELEGAGVRMIESALF